MNRRFVVAFSVASAVFLGACGSSSNPAAPKPGEVSTGTPDGDGGTLQGLMLASASKVAEAATSRFELEMTMPGPAGPFDVRSSGAVDNASGLMSMELDLAGLQIPGGDGTTTALFDGESFYYRFPAALQAAFGGKEWVRMGLDTLSGVGGFDLEAVVEQFKQSDPTTNVALMAGAATDIEEVGTEEVRGVSTRHFTMTVDLERAVANAPERVREAVAQMVTSMGTSSYPAEIWIADDGLPRRLVYSLDLSQAQVPGAQAASGQVDIRMELFDFGADVDVDVPPAADTADLADLFGRLGGLGG